MSFVVLILLYCYFVCCTDALVRRVLVTAPTDRPSHRGCVVCEYHYKRGKLHHCHTKKSDQDIRNSHTSYHVPDSLGVPARL